MPKKKEKSKYAGKFFGTSTNGSYDYKVKLPKEMTRSEFVDWFINQEGWKEVENSLEKDDWKEFTDIVNEWDKSMNFD
jgi:enolase